MARTDASVNAAWVELLATLLARIANAHSARTLAKEVANAFTSCDVSALAIAGVTVTRDGAGWRIVPARADLVELVPGLAIAGTLPTDPPFHAALAQVIAMALRHVDTIERLATISRTSHAKRKDLANALARTTSPVVARSSRMQSVLARVDLVAPHPTTVLLTGESGTGKELVARELHRLSSRAHRPFLHLDCAALPATLVDSELFGHERGAFTGADRAHAGIFERANGGTLLLDELGELDLAVQAKLLRVLQERTVRRLGGTSDLAIDVRVVAATNRDLRAMLAAGTFRADLYYRLAIFQIELPALRDRHGDLAPLATALLDELAAKLGVPPPALAPRDLARLEAHDWPGNVRELRNALEALLITGELPALAARGAPRANTSLAGTVRDAIEAALRASRGRIYGPKGAAVRLGLPPATLQSKLKRLGIDPARYS